FKRRLLADGSGAIADLDMLGIQGQHVTVVENTPGIHNLVVCTLCSCYPLPLLGLPPRWYKSAPYRSRAIIDPRGVLKEFGVELAPEVEVRVWDSTSEVRYRVLRESMPPAAYLTWSYYEHWYYATVRSLLEAGFLTMAELRSGHAAADRVRRKDAMRASDVAEAGKTSGVFTRPIDAAPRFSVGDGVVTRKLQP